MTWSSSFGFSVLYEYPSIVAIEPTTSGDESTIVVFPYFFVSATNSFQVVGRSLILSVRYMKPVVPQSFTTEYVPFGIVRRLQELRVGVLRDVLQLRPVERKEPLLGDELLRHVAGRAHEVVAAGTAPQLRRERLVRVVERLLDLDAGRLRERRVGLRVHVLRPVVVEERPLGLGRRERVGSAEATETRRRERRRSGAGNEAASVDGSLPDRELVAHSFPPSSKSRASSSAHETATRSPSASASMPPLSPDRCCRANTS